MNKYYLVAQFPRYLASRLRLVGASGSEQNLSSVTSDTVWEKWRYQSFTFYTVM